MPFRWDTYEVEEERTLEELKAKYGDASAKKQSKEQMLESANRQYDDIWQLTHQQVQWARECSSCISAVTVPCFVSTLKSSAPIFNDFGDL
jgi:hypothetical protein